MPRKTFTSALLAAAALALLGAPARGEAAPVEIELAARGAAITGAPLQLRIALAGPREGESLPVSLFADGRPVATMELAAGEHDVEVEAGLAAGRRRIEARAGSARAELRLSVLPGWLSVVPPLVAILLALVFKDVLVALALGVFSGALFLHGWNPFVAFARAIDQFLVPALADESHAAILIFSTLLGGMVGVIGRSGGTHGIVDALTPFATSARRGQVATWLMGVLIFFDDYANTLIVGNTMRPITDRLRISREKLAYIVDSTAAPVASVVPISTWIGYEIGLIGDAFSGLELGFNPFTAFVGSILFRFYPIFALVLGFTVAFSCRDFGPMLKAERRASDTGKLVGEGDVPLADYDSPELAPVPGKPRRAANALLPIATVIGVTLAGLWLTGVGAVARADYPSTLRWVQEVFSAADSYKALLWASLAGLTVAMALALTQRILTVRQATEAMVGGFKSMLLALATLLLAWSIGAVCGELHTAEYLVGVTSGVLSAHWLPVLTFVLSAAISFATGTSWGTMAILMPLVIPISHHLSLAGGLAVDDRFYYLLLLGTISSVLAGSVWGDHCSPISDTTILSSMASGCDHIAHVRTQLPYALGIGVLGMAIGDVPTAFGLSPWISLAAGSAVIVAGVLWLGKRSDWRPGAAAKAA